MNSPTYGKSYVAQMYDAVRTLEVAVLNYHREDFVRMLGLWESECEPAAIFRDGVLEGLGLAGDPEMRVIIASQYPGTWSNMPGLQAFDPYLTFASDKSPCGECHLRHGEICDICGAYQE